MSIRHPYDRSVHAIHYDAYPDPAAGVGYIILLPEMSRIQIVSVEFTLTTAIAVADRFVYVAPSTLPQEHLHLYAERNQAASLAFLYSGYMGAPNENGIAPLATRVRIPLGVDLIFDNVDSIIITADNLQAADQFTNLYIYYNYWHTGQLP